MTEFNTGDRVLVTRESGTTFKGTVVSEWGSGPEPGYLVRADGFADPAAWFARRLTLIDPNPWVPLGGTGRTPQVAVDPLEAAKAERADLRQTLGNLRNRVENKDAEIKELQALNSKLQARLAEARTERDKAVNASVNDKLVLSFSKATVDSYREERVRLQKKIRDLSEEVRRGRYRESVRFYRFGDLVYRQREGAPLEIRLFDQPESSWVPSVSNTVVGSALEVSEANVPNARKGL